MMNRPRYWGYHLLLDLKSCDLDKVRDSKYLEGMTKRLVDAIGMKAYGEPIMQHFGHDDPSIAGWTVVQLIETSDITGHFCDESGDAYLDIFSCKPFEVTDTISFVENELHPKNMVHRFFVRQA